MVFLSAAGWAQRQYTTQIEPLRTEKWWGHFTGGGPAQPFTEKFSSEPPETGCFTVPLMVSDQGRYLWSEHPFAAESDGRAFTVISRDAPLKATKGGRTLREAYLYCVHKNIWPGSGGPANHLFPLPVYDTGLSAVTAAAGDDLVYMADALLSAGFPIGTILIPDGWQEASLQGDSGTDLFTSISRTAEALQERGFTVMVTVTPYIPAAGRGYVAAARAGVLLKDESGRPAVIHTTAGYYACLDLTRPAVAEAMSERLEKLTGTEGNLHLYFDCHEALSSLSAGKREDFMHRWVALGERFGAAMYPLDAAVPAQWHPYSVSPSAELSWESLRRILACAINAGLTGHIYPFLSLGGCVAPDEEMLLRALQLAAYMPIPSLPVSENLIPEGKYRDALLRTLQQRHELNGYVKGLMDETLATGEPVIRHMEYQFPGQGFANCSDQFMLGSKYLVAPVLDRAGKRTVRLPRGMWTAGDGTKFRGPRVISVDVSDGKIPVFRLR